MKADGLIFEASGLNMPEASNAQNTSRTSLRRRYRILFAVARGLALLLGVFTLLNVVGEIRNPGFDANLWWIDVRFANPTGRSLVLAATAIGLISFGAYPRWAPCRGWLLSLLILLLMGAAAMNSWTFYRLVAAGGIRSRSPIPLSLAVMALLGLLLWGVQFRPRVKSTSAFDYVVCAISMIIGAVSFPLAQMYCFGLTDYRRPADVIVVFGCRVTKSGVPSMALADRVKTGVELFLHGLGSRLVFSGGPGDGPVHETEAMRDLAISLGVPASAIELDRAGLNTQASVANLVRASGTTLRPRVLAVSNFYHLPRIKLCFRRAGWEVWTVPATETRRLYYQEKFMLREVAALWWYYLNPN